MAFSLDFSQGAIIAARFSRFMRVVFVLTLDLGSAYRTVSANQERFDAQSRARQHYGCQYKFEPCMMRFPSPKSARKNAIFAFFQLKGVGVVMKRYKMMLRIK